MRRFRRSPGFFPRRLLRPFPFLGRGAGWPRPALRHLQLAHRLAENGQFAEAAGAFERIAEVAAELGLPQAAPLSVEAGLAWIQAGEVARGLTLAERGLDWLKEGGRGTRAAILRDRVLAALRQGGHRAEADAWAKKYAGSSAGTPAPARRDLPTTCPQCGGQVRPDEVEWIDPGTAVCDYCGSVLKAGEG